MSAVTINCPECLKAVEIQEEWNNIPVSCPYCQKQFTPQIPVSPENQKKDETTPSGQTEEGISEIDQLKKQLAEQQDKFLYLQSEYQNFRKRSARDISDARSHAIADTLIPFLTVSDFLAMAQVAAEKTDNLDAIKQGLTMIIAQFDKALDELGVRKFTSVGTKFDPDLHDAIGREPSESVEEGNIIREWNCGYKIGEKLLRPARVMVSAGPAVESEEKSEEGKNENAGSAGESKE